MQKKNWFRPKSYGYGLMPISWQGWLSTLLLLTFFILGAYANNFFNPPSLTLQNLANYLVEVALLIGLFLLWAQDKTDGEIEWKWGNK